MAADLSLIIKEGLCGTLKDLLAKDAVLKETTKIHTKDVDEIEFIKIDSEFAFDKASTIFSFYVPANSASIIFNIMMGSSEFDIATNIDDDTADAMGEFISNISGGLVTAINAEDIEELGQVKFNIPHKEILNGSTISQRENLFKFSITLEEYKIALFIAFNENFIPYINEILKSEITYYKEEEPEETTKKEEEQSKQTSAVEEKKEEDTPSEEEQDTAPKTKKIKKPIIIAAIVLFIVLIIIIILSMSSSKEEPPVKKVEVNTTKKSDTEVDIVKYKTLKRIDFKLSDIDIRRLNARLEALTKYEILNQQELEAQALEEKNRLLHLMREKELLEFAKRNKEEPLPKQNQTAKKSKTTKLILDPNDNTKLKFILVDSFKYTLFNNLLKKIDSVNAKVSLCNDENGKTTIFLGPFEDEGLRIQMETLIKSKHSMKTILTNLTTKEFNERCNF